MRARRALLATLLLALSLLPTLAGATAASAAEPQSLVTVTLDSLSPSVPQRSSEITVTGRVTNTSKKQIFRPRAYFWRNQAPITDREGLDQALQSPSNEPLGARYIPSFDNLYPSPDKPYLAAGDTATFSLKAKVSDLALSPTPGVYLMGVHVLQNEMPPAVGRARLLVPVLAGPPRNHLQMTSVVALNSRPSLVCSTCGPARKGVFSDHHLADEIAPGGRLDALLSAADRPTVSLAVDPQLIDEVSTMSDGYQILGDGGSAANGPGRPDAQRWLQKVTRMSRDRDAYQLLYGSVDIAAAAHSGQQRILQASQAASKRVELTASLPLLVWPGGGDADAPTLTAAQSLNPRAVLLSDSSTGATAPLLQGLGPAPVVNYTSGSYAGGPGPDPSDTPVHLQQRLLAESWIQAATTPAGTTLGRVRVLSTAAQAAGDNEAIRVPWLKQATLTQLLGSTPAPWSKQPHYPPGRSNSELTASQLDAINQLSRSWSTWQDLLAEPDAAQASADAAVARAASVRRPKTDSSFRDYLAPQQDEIDSRLDAIQISVTRRVLTPKSRVSFPVTIRNRLPAPDNTADRSTNAVRVRLDFASANRQRLNVLPLKLETIEAGQNFQGDALVDARTNGTVRVTAQLYTASGFPVGRPATIDVRATQAGTVGWFIAIGAGIVLVGTTALRIRQVTRERARTAAATEGGGDPPDREPVPATRSAPAEDTAAQDPATSIDV